MAMKPSTDPQSFLARGFSDQGLFIKSIAHDTGPFLKDLPILPPILSAKVIGCCMRQIFGYFWVDCGII
jgi:hypothetical protein